MKKQWGRRQLFATGVWAAASQSAMAQNIFGKKKSDSKPAESNAAAMVGTMPANAFVTYIGIASDLGAQGTLKLLEVYPPEKVEQINLNPAV